MKSAQEEQVVVVWVKPRASRNQVKVREDGILEVWVTAPPAEGQANRAVIEQLADYFGVAPSRIELLSGVSHRQKRFRIRK